MGITSSLQQFMADNNATEGAFSDFESNGTADTVCFDREIKRLTIEGKITSVVSVDGVSTTCSVTKTAKGQATLDVRTAGARGNALAQPAEGLRDTDDRSKAVQKTPWRVSLDSMVKRVQSVEYIHPKNIPHMTIAIVILDNGYALVGESAPADAANYNEPLGENYAYENALKKMWPLEAYVMRDMLSGKVDVIDPQERWNPAS